MKVRLWSQTSFKCGLAEEFGEGCTLVVSSRHHTNLCFSHQFEAKLLLEWSNKADITTKQQTGLKKEIDIFPLVASFYTMYNLW